jgi:hypothetical protein
MWRAKDRLYLEPGEIAVLADLARRPVPLGPPLHPNTLLLAALAEALGDMTDGAGVVIAPASQAVVHQAAQAYVRRSRDGQTVSDGHAPAGSESVRPA